MASLSFCSACCTPWWPFGALWGPSFLFAIWTFQLHNSCLQAMKSCRTSPVERRGNFMCLSNPPSVSVHLFPLHQVCSLRHDFCPVSPEIYPLRLKICTLWPEICHNRPEICLVMPEICHYKLKSLHPGFKSSLLATNLHSYASNPPSPPSN